MKAKVSIYVAASLDGFIARKDGDIAWLDDHNNDSSEDYGYIQFMDSVDALIMGRNTFEKILTFRQWPYGDKPVIVLSTQALRMPERVPNTVRVMTADPATLVESLSAEGAKHLYIDGGNTIQRFIAAGSADEITITRIPILIGKGIPLFGTLDRDIKLKHIETRLFANGFVQSRYQLLQQT